MMENIRPTGGEGIKRNALGKEIHQNGKHERPNTVESLRHEGGVWHFAIQSSGYQSQRVKKGPATNRNIFLEGKHRISDFCLGG